MAFPDPGIIQALKDILMKNSGGITISGIAKKTKLNRNLIAKYLDYLLLSGQLEMKQFGSSKVYSLTSRIPVSSLIQYVFDPVLMLDEDRRIAGMNDPFLQIFGEKRDALMGKKIGEIRNVNLTTLILNTLPETRPDSFGDAQAVPFHSGHEPRYFTIRTLAVVYENGKSGTSIILHDITAEKNCQIIQYLDGARQDALTEDISELVIRVQPDGTVLSMNGAALRFFQKNPGKYHGLKIDSIVLHDDLVNLKKVIREIGKNNPFDTCTCRIIDPNGGIHPFSWVIRGIFDQTSKLHEYQVIGCDTTALNMAELTIDRFIADQWFLTRKAYEITRLPHDANIYEVIGKGVLDLLPNAIVAVNSFDLNENCTTTQCFLGEKEREIFSEYLGEDVVGYVMSPPDSPERSHIIQNLMGGQFIKVPGNLEVMMMGQVPRDVCEKIEKALNIGDMYVLGLASQGILFGNISLILRKGDILKHSVVLEIFFRLSSLGLKCRHLEGTKKISVSSRTGNPVNSR